MKVCGGESGGVSFSGMRFLNFFLMRRGMGDEYIPHATPRKCVLINVTCGDLLEAVHSIAGRKGGGGRKEVRGLAPHGSGWPSGARSTQPNQTIQVEGRAVSNRSAARFAETQRREDAQTKAIGFSSLPLCASAVGLASFGCGEGRVDDGRPRLISMLVFLCVSAPLRLCGESWRAAASQLRGMFRELGR
jgi:hypothetical protein